MSRFDPKPGLPGIPDFDIKKAKVVKAPPAPKTQGPAAHLKGILGAKKASLAPKKAKGGK